MKLENLMTVGFIFSHDLDKVLLISKKRPAWQKGRLNGVGGHLNEEELSALNFISGWAREVKEEINLSVTIKDVVDIGRITVG